MNSFLFYVCRPRSRGKTAVEDEDSMDGLEAAETENTVETGNERMALMLSGRCFFLGSLFYYTELWQVFNLVV